MEKARKFLQLKSACNITEIFRCRLGTISLENMHTFGKIMQKDKKQITDGIKTKHKILQKFLQTQSLSI